ncbi:MAG: Type 1 glutamine amidotransferase-like domain-containing protein [Candidatus Portnoybacteria bacterium]|nr:Type 1 glutamine amidotransferase-like domain-containing protein [Candidatus Portnoybacteria bacterium]
MTKYVLHGGATSLPSVHNKNFFREMVKELPQPVKILTVYFANAKEKWSELFEDDKKKFSSFNPETKMEFAIAGDDIETLVNQISSNDVIYIRGGRNLLVYELFSKIKNLSQLFQGKVVGGSSAGAYVFSRYYYSNDKDRIMEGLGILPIKTFAHYSEDKTDKLQKLKEYGEDLEVYTIPEAEFVVIEK